MNVWRGLRRVYGTVRAAITVATRWNGQFQHQSILACSRRLGGTLEVAETEFKPGIDRWSPRDYSNRGDAPESSASQGPWSHQSVDQGERQNGACNGWAIRHRYRKAAC